MKYKYNPFRPSSPVFKGMFAGRSREIHRTDEILFQTKFGNPTNVLIIGERGIGKSSLLLVANYFSKGELQLSTETHNFLTVQVSLNKEMSLLDFAKKIKNALSREISKLDKSIDYIKKTWDFIQRIEIAGSGIKKPESSLKNSDVSESLIYSIVDTVRTLTTKNAISDLGLKSQKDGLVILLDEADNASKTINLGSFIKTLSETLVMEDCNKVLFVLAGLPGLRDVLIESHESSLRLFEEFELSALSKNEVFQVSKKGIAEYNEKYPDEVLTIDENALDSIYTFSEGYPHFVQQICSSALLKDEDSFISEEDVTNGIVGKGGAVDILGTRYYKDLFYNRINVDSYRQILIIMAQNWNEWVTKDEIRKKFKGKSSALNNGIKALKERNIILTKRGSRGNYRLQWVSFAFWIRNYSKYKSKIK